MINTLVNTKTIYHCSHADIKGGGGVETYLASLVNSQLSGITVSVISCLKNLDQQQPQFLHIHDPDMLMDFREECPAIFTLHNHSSYCPSGTKYLANGGKVCDRILNPLGCAWGHLIDGCGSRRPQKIIGNWYNTHQILEILKKLKIPVIANSDYVRQQIINSGLPPERVVTLRFGVKSPKITTAPLNWATHQNQRILFVGRIVPDKGVEWLIKALAQTKPTIHLDIAGDGWSKASMEKLAHQMGLSHRITWHGWLKREKLESLYQQSLAVVFPSLWPEPAGLVTLEAYSHYRPIIASAVGGIPEHVQDNQTGILVSPNNIKQLAAAINELAINYPKSRLMGEVGQAWYQQEFTINTHMRRLTEIYAKTIAEFEA
ncbi:glycosyltransferase family 4 protein [Umezakia ovalisporum]|jgi:glycosyltransferase involved in cell wall biosynthesis|uniref:Glycosyltransferase family 4 protein n=1 Tax=Umezakia ovalisporum FSS-43 TaxID=2740520 RepID=A0ABT6K4I9_9CYAN|nr:glycosyltransferase family 4 protein [Umezakia ovalisporum]MBI1241394.1 glycosyltransferase [Nostoc sp. RI_552]MDH6057172.1 glycosyltransferase family 4 protein [Umezakia ovalisporum FSS-43]MDH6069022.1 glycosyltransferase family 4 protein [Umezakia ovalisporum APH033B]MDH6071712.1 glycosyltransferase family 4 protein [Umezakia ovalisporum CobakiLakeA]MDH6073400.1 glycosyltransferase family 4 protein [Umezakia ovalisporum CS-1034]